MIRTGISTSEAVAEALANAGTPLSYGATAESWREAFTTISGENEEITPRETEGVTGWSSTNETALTTFNTEAGDAKITLHFVETNEGQDVTTAIKDVVAVPLKWDEEAQNYVEDPDRSMPTVELVDEVYELTNIEAGHFGVAWVYAGSEYHSEEVYEWSSSAEVVIEFMARQN